MIKAINAGQWRNAETLASRARDPLVAKLFYWYAYKEEHGKPAFQRIAGFIRQNPDWPHQARLRLSAERALLRERGIADSDITGWFSEHAPQTADGMYAYLAALQRTNRMDALRDTLGGWWRTTLMSPDDQKRFLQSYGSHIDRETHHVRMDHLLFRQHYTNARSLAALLGDGYPALVQARIAVAEGQQGVDAAIANVPAHLSRDPGLLYERLKWRRVNNRDFGAMEILHAPPPAEMVTNLPDWWRERHIIARRLIQEGKFEDAYMLVSRHQQKEGFPFAQAEFLAGFLALKIEKPWRAFEHFEALYHRTSSPISRSRGAYWAGRASEDLGHAGIADQWYRAAARHQITYYGQLAMARLDAAQTPPEQFIPRRTIEAKIALNANEMVQAVRLLHAAGMRRDTTAFLNALSRQIDTPDEYYALAELATSLDHHHNAIQVAKAGLQKNIMLVDHAYPTILSRLRGIDRVEWALVHALIRQESEFDFAARSHAGASGLMQLMPATAAETARKLGIAHQQSWLVDRPDHNIRLGAAYLEEMIRRYDGSYALALAAYNAGPGRADRWLREFGDPRKGEIDLVDWVELIPIYETRNYVQRVLESTYIYRLKLRDVQQYVGAPIHVAMSGDRRTR